MVELMDGWVNILMNKSMDQWIIASWTNGLVNTWMDGWIDGWMDWWTN
jgi:hypothetical protein